MRSLKVLVLSCVAALTLASSVAVATYYSPRQYYSGWYKHPRKEYYYRTYYYKPKPTYVGYKHHYVIYHPTKYHSRGKKYAYYYNPYKKQYWGRCPLHSGGEEAYALLPEAERKESLEEIPEKAFPKEAEQPPVPESSDGVKLEGLPDELPGEAAGVPIN